MIALIIPTTVMISMESPPNLKSIDTKLARQAQIIILDKQPYIWILKKIEWFKDQPDINATDDLGNTRIHYAGFVRNGDLMIEMLKAGANPAKTNAHNQDFTDIIEELLKNLTDRRERNDLATQYQRIIRHLAKTKSTSVFAQGDTLLHKAIKINDTLLAIQLLKILNPNTLNQSGRSALHEALAGSTYDSTLITNLLNNNANPNLPDENGNTTLHSAALRFSTNTDLANLLIQHGAQVDTLNNQGQTPIEILLESLNAHAREYQRLSNKLIKLKQQERDGTIPVKKFIFDADKKETLQKKNDQLRDIDHEVAVLFLLLLHSHNKNKQDEFGNSPLYHIILIMSTSDEVHKILLPIITHFLPELNLNIQNREGFTPLHAAVNAQDFTLVQLLLQHGANPLIKSFTKPLTTQQMRTNTPGQPHKTPRELALEMRVGLPADQQTILNVIIDMLLRAEQKREAIQVIDQPNLENTSHFSNTNKE